MTSEPCELCGGETWTKLRGNWKRCKNCGRLETTIEKRTCKSCGKDIGRYAKKTKLYCFDCNKNKPEESYIICSVIGCENKLKKPQIKSGICKQCNREKNDWLTPNGHLWKSKALFILNEMQVRGELLRILKKEYPELNKDILGGWLIRQMKAGTVNRIRHGLYQTTGKGVPEPPVAKNQTIIVVGKPGSLITVRRVPGD